MQKRKEKCNSNLTVTKITKVHNWMFRNFSDHCLHLLLKKIQLVGRLLTGSIRGVAV